LSTKTATTKSIPDSSLDVVKSTSLSSFNQTFQVSKTSSSPKPDSEIPEQNINDTKINLWRSTFCDFSVARVTRSDGFSLNG
jgi:hypothetical protein